MTLEEIIIKVYGDNKITVTEYFQIKDIWNEAIRGCTKIAERHPSSYDAGNLKYPDDIKQEIAKAIRSREA